MTDRKMSPLGKMIFDSLNAWNKALAESAQLDKLRVPTSMTNTKPVVTDPIKRAVNKGEKDV